MEEIAVLTLSMIKLAREYSSRLPYTLWPQYLQKKVILLQNLSLMLWKSLHFPQNPQINSQKFEFIFIKKKVAHARWGGRN